MEGKFCVAHNVYLMAEHIELAGRRTRRVIVMKSTMMMMIRVLLLLTANELNRIRRRQNETEELQLSPGKWEAGRRRIEGHIIGSKSSFRDLFTG